MLWLLTLASAHAGVERTQEFELTAGWNAIFLEVDPGGVPVEEVFGGELVDAVARYFVPQTPVRFVESPEEAPWKVPGWSVWYSPSRAESFLSDLHAVDGGAAYLVHAVKAGRLAVRGEVKPMPRNWTTESFNLTGFTVESGGMTFAQYFAGTQGLLGTRVYRKQNGSWQKITNLAGTPIKAGEACWVWCEGATSYTGPLELGLNGAPAVRFSGVSLLTVIEMRNRINSPFTVQASIESNDGLPLFRQVVDLANGVTESKPLQGVSPVATLGAGETGYLRLELRPELMLGTGGSAILKLSTSNGIVIRVPVHYRPD